jgi:LmbE family N-acetylglucosaminyl deacetylase
MLRHLFLSPHFDDAVGSCGGTIARLVSLGHSVRILTAFGGIESEPFSMPARVLHAEWKLEQPVRDRRLEDASACRILGCEASFLDFPDAIYRHTDKGRHLYPTFESLRGSPSSEDSTLPVRLAERVRGYLSDENTVVYCPLAIGAHVDHVIVRDCGRIISTRHSRVLFYRDFYYDRQSNGETEASDMTGVNVTLTLAEGRAKLAAFSEYKSQISDLFTTPSAMKSYFDNTGRNESFFHPRATPKSHLAEVQRALNVAPHSNHSDECS